MIIQIYEWVCDEAPKILKNTKWDSFIKRKHLQAFAYLQHLLNDFCCLYSSAFSSAVVKIT